MYNAVHLRVVRHYHILVHVIQKKIHYRKTYEVILLFASDINKVDRRLSNTRKRTVLLLRHILVLGNPSDHDSRCIGASYKTNARKSKSNKGYNCALLQIVLETAYCLYCTRLQYSNMTDIEFTLNSFFKFTCI